MFLAIQRDSNELEVDLFVLFVSLINANASTLAQKS